MPLTVQRPIAKTIAAKNIVAELVGALKERGCTINGEEKLKLDWTTRVLKHLEAYDQRG